MLQPSLGCHCGHTYCLCPERCNFKSNVITKDTEYNLLSPFREGYKARSITKHPLSVILVNSLLQRLPDPTKPLHYSNLTYMNCSQQCCFPYKYLFKRLCHIVYRTQQDCVSWKDGKSMLFVCPHCTLSVYSISAAFFLVPYGPQNSTSSDLAQQK